MRQIRHLVSAVVLLLAHGTFFARGLYLRRAGRGPNGIDRAARTLSQLLLPISAFTGLLIFQARASRLLLLHLLLGLAPLAAIILVFVGRLALRRRTEAPWLLPAVNLALIGAALVTGFALGRG